MGSCNNNITVNASIDTVWQTLRNFHDMSWAPGVITSVQAVGDKGGDEVGAKRILNEAFHETLLSLDDSGRTFSYSIDDGPGPVAKENVTRYVGTVEMSTVEGGTLVVWRSEFESGTDNEVTAFCDPIYQALLGALKASLE